MATDHSTAPVPGSWVHRLDSVARPGQPQPVCQTAFTAFTVLAEEAGGK